MMPYPLLWDAQVSWYGRDMLDLESAPSAQGLLLRETAFELPCRAKLDALCQQPQLQGIGLSLAVTGVDLDARRRDVGHDLIVSVRHRVTLSIQGASADGWTQHVVALLQYCLPLSMLGAGAFTMDRRHPQVAAVLRARQADALEAQAQQLAIRRLMRLANDSFGVFSTSFGLAGMRDIRH